MKFADYVTLIFPAIEIIFTLLTNFVLVSWLPSFDLSWINHDTDFTSCLKSKAILQILQSHWRFFQIMETLDIAFKRLMSTSDGAALKASGQLATITAMTLQLPHPSVASNGIHHNPCSLVLTSQLRPTNVATFTSRSIFLLTSAWIQHDGQEPHFLYQLTGDDTR